MKNKIDMPREVEEIIEIIENNGYEAYIVGGCIRDFLLGRNPGDWDITTSALPEKIRNIFQGKYRVIDTGLKHGTVTVISSNNNHYEITTFRIDGEYINGRSPERVEFTKNLREDLKRRDFTINAMAYNNRVGIEDHFNGRIDLQNKVIKAVGVAEERFSEDALRILRGIRFSCQLGFEIDIDTERAMKKKKEGLSKISKERIREEFSKIILSENASYGIKKLVHNGLMEYIIPEINSMVGFEQHTQYHDKDVFEHTMGVLEKVTDKLDLRLSALLHDIAKPTTFTIDERGQGHFYNHDIVGSEMCEKILRKLKFDNKTINKVRLLVLEHMNREKDMKNITLKKLIRKIGKENLNDLFLLQIADIASSAKEYSNYDYIVRTEKKAQKILERKDPIIIKDLDITGKEIMENGIEEGILIGEMLHELLELVLEKPRLNKKEILIEIVRKKVK